MPWSMPLPPMQPLSEDIDARIRRGGDEATAAMREYGAECKLWGKNLVALAKQVVPQWIPVEERLPESGETVLVWHYGEVQMAWLNYATNGAAYFVRDTHYNFEPTHWMPLPEPPEVTA